MNQNDWECENATKLEKGDIGMNEGLEYFIKKGFIVYIPKNKGSHPFDTLIAKKNKKEISIVEFKTKARRNDYPDTGINLSSYKTYKYIEEKYNLKVFICFVDEASETIYGNYLDVLDKPQTIKWEHEIDGKMYIRERMKYPVTENDKIRYFHLGNMEPIAHLSSDVVIILKDKSTRRYPYNIPKNEKITIIKNIEKINVIKFSTNKIKEKEVWVAEYWKHDFYTRIGIYEDKFDAFISCLQEWKKTMKQQREVYNKTNKKHRFLIYNSIKELGFYRLTKDKVINKNK